ncbi:MAG: nicotinamidase-related amidase/alkylated DNA repair dioxygenase AlkB [Myxococcota bacterium]|jgi:nicotinamidase-related amidase/alkylated DNA repair dioxygenase AlkB
MHQAALVIIDMQDELLTSQGMLKKPVKPAPLVAAISLLIAAARAAGAPVVWVTSTYPPREEPPPPLRPPRPEGGRFAGVPMNTDRLASGHAGRPCCAPGSPTALLHPPLAALVAPDDLQVVKHRYSAFGETTLLAELQARGVGSVVLCGVLANVSVRATAADAFFSGLSVTVPEDAVGAASVSRLREGLTAIRRYGDVGSVATVLSEWSSERSGLGAGDSGVLYGLLLDDLIDALARVREEVSWQVMRHRGGVVPRQIAIQGTIDDDGAWPVYRHPADEQPPLTAWTPTVDRLRLLVEARLGQPINHVLIQRYPDGASNISPHADKTLDVLRGSAIVNFSLGATRTMLLQNKDRREDGQFDFQRVDLPHGSLFVLGWQTNRTFKHGIRADRRSEAEKRTDELRDGCERISLTFRTIATFQGADGRLRGQGARSGPPLPPEEEGLALLIAFGHENRESDFDWDRHYGPGFDVLNFHTRKA